MKSGVRGIRNWVRIITKSGDDQARVWEDGWADHEQRQMKRLAELSLSEKLDWLEEAHRLVIQLGAEATNPAERD